MEYRKVFRTYQLDNTFNWSNIRVAKAQNSASNLFSRNQLSKIRQKAIRAGVWFKVLPRIDRVLVDLTIQITDSVRSSFLAKSLVVVVSKLDSLLEIRLVRLIRIVGQPLAEKASLIAQYWGNLNAKSWATDRCFALYLTVMQANIR